MGRVYRTIFSRSGVGLVIMPTYDCNFRCPYCFERHRLCKGQEWLSQNMAPEMIDTIFQAFKDYRERGYKIGNCTLYGGEPLLASNIETVRTICQHCKELGMEIGAITNGYDLESFLDLMDEFKFNNLQITVDGVDEVATLASDIDGMRDAIIERMGNEKRAWEANSDGDSLKEKKNARRKRKPGTSQNVGITHTTLKRCLTMIILQIQSAKRRSLTKC